MIRIRSYPDWVEPLFLAYLWNSPVVRRQIEKSAKTGTGIHKISQPEIRGIELPLPPTAEQHRIANALNKHMARLDEIEVCLRAARQRLETLRDLVMTAAATGALAGEVKQQDMPIAGSPATTDTPLPPLAAGWRWGRLQEIADVIGGVTKDSKNQHALDQREVPYLRVANAQRARLELAQVATIRVPPKTLEKLRLRRGDLLMTEGGDRDKLGRGWIWEDQIEDCIYQNHLFRARILKQATHPKLLGWYVNSAARAWFEANGKQSVNLASISITTVRQLPVPLPPAGEQEQAKLVELGEQVLARVDRLMSVCDQGLAHCVELRNALLEEAFSGRLIPQDPEDEPAEHFLMRIRAEREVAGADRKPARRPAGIQSSPQRPAMPKVLARTDISPPDSSTTGTPIAAGEQTTLPLEFTA